MTIESTTDLAGMRAAGKLVAQALREMRSVVSPGMTTGQLDDDGYIADAAITVVLPPGTARARALAQCAEAAFAKAVQVAAARVRIAELGRAVEAEVETWGCSVVHDLSGHGVGRRLHEPPSVPNFFSPLTRGHLEDGLVIALEPIVLESPSEVFEDEDGWTIRTATGCLAAHYEHTIVIREGRAEVLTAA